MKPLAFMAAILCTALLARAEVKTQTVEYKDGAATLKGFLAYDDAIQGKRPGIVVVPEWWGMTDYPKSRAKQLAGMGYVALVADIYGDGFATDDPKVAGQKSGQAKKNDWCRTRGKLALRQLVKNEHVDANNLAAIGYCFGGGCVLEMARAGDDLKGVVSFHGTLDTKAPAQPGQVKAKVLVLTGADDPIVTKDKVEAFEKEMKSAGADAKVITYPGAKHAFTNPNADKYGINGIQYNKQADEQSWQAMKDFFAKIFSEANPKPSNP